MPFDYKKEYKKFYLPPKKPVIVTIPAMNFVAVRGKGDPNAPEGDYKAAISLLYGIAFTIKMGYKGDYKIDGFFEYVVYRRWKVCGGSRVRTMWILRTKRTSSGYR